MLKQENAHARIRIARGSNQCHGCRPGNIWPVATSGVRDCEQWFPTIGGTVLNARWKRRPRLRHIVNQRGRPCCKATLQRLSLGAVIPVAEGLYYFLRGATAHPNHDASAHERVWQPAEPRKCNGAECRRLLGGDGLAVNDAPTNHRAAAMAGIQKAAYFFSRLVFAIKERVNLVNQQRRKADFSGYAAKQVRWTHIDRLYRILHQQLGNL